MIEFIRSIIKTVYIYIGSVYGSYNKCRVKSTSYTNLSSCDEPEIMYQDDIEGYDKNYKQYKQYKQYTYESITQKKSQYTRRYCGWCNSRIYSPIYIYMDKVYCNIICRNNQRIKDNPIMS